jgi:hypothetical protein
MTLEEWLQGARNACLISNVPIGKVRTNEEHTEIVCASRKGQEVLLAERSTKSFASQARLSLFNAERVARLNAVIAVGDLVWAQNANGVDWMPAVVSARHYCSLTESGKSSLLSIKIVMTQDEFMDAKRRHSRNKLLRRDNCFREDVAIQNISPSPTSATTVMSVVSLISSQSDRQSDSTTSENRIIRYLFDLLDEKGCGSISVDQIENCQRCCHRDPRDRPQLHTIIQSSATLSLIFGKSTESELLFQVLLRILHVDDVARSRCVSKEKFVECCLALHEMKVFNSYGPQ